MKAGGAKQVRCAIYTRVSTDQGLEQDFNSLDAQYDASQSYIRSQAHAGWTLVRSKYDDGGFSGGNTDRPALQRLLDGAGSPEDVGKRTTNAGRLIADVRPGTMLAREWNGRIHRVAVLADGFAWSGKTYPSLSKIAQAITGTRWNGPRFFGLRDKPSKEAGAS